MATLGQLKSRIVSETNRDDLLDDLASALNSCIAQAIDFYANSRFTFNELRTTSIAAQGSEYLTIPTNFRFVDELFVIVGGVRYPLRKLQMTQVEDLYSVPLTGQPTNWAEYNFQARLWPTPNIAYTMIWIGVADVTPALDYTDDASTNDWTTRGADLIDARTRFLLYRDYFRDDGGMQIAKAAETEAYANLKGVSNRMMTTGRVRQSW